MKYKKIIYFLDNKTNRWFKIFFKKWFEIVDEAGVYSSDKEIKCNRQC